MTWRHLFSNLRHWFLDLSHWFSNVMNWFLDYGIWRILLFSVICLVIVMRLRSKILSILISQRLRREQAEEKARLAPLIEYVNFSQARRVEIISTVLSALLRPEPIGRFDLGELTELNPVLLDHVLEQLEFRGFIMLARSSDDPHAHQEFYAPYDSHTHRGLYTLTPRGVDLYDEYHAGKQSEVHMRDIFNVASNSIVTNRSTIINAFNGIESKLDAESQAALKELANKVLDSGNSEAAENLDGFLTELHSDSPRKSILNSLFNGIVAALPTIASATDIAENIRKIIAGS